jgi:hypothetical protein
MKRFSRRLMRNRRGGVSVAIAVMMAMVIAALFINKITIWGQVLEREDKDRFNEVIEISSIQFIEDETKLIVGVRNTGSVTAHIVTVYIKPLDPTMSTTRYGMDKGIDIYIDPGVTKQVIPEDLVLDPEVDLFDDFVISVHTERGNSNSKTYTLETTPPYPEWFAESANPLVILAEESSFDKKTGKFDLTIWNRVNVDIELDLLVVTQIVLSGSASPKVQIIVVDYTCIAGDKLNIQKIAGSLVGSYDGVRIELVSSHSWVVGQFVFIF